MPCRVRRVVRGCNYATVTPSRKATNGNFRETEQGRDFLVAITGTIYVAVTGNTWLLWDLRGAYWKVTTHTP